MKIIIKVLIVAASLWVAELLVDGITVSGETTPKKIGTLIAVAFVFGLVNAVLKPIIKTVGCAFYVLTLGLFALIVNAGLLLLTSWISNRLDLSFNVTGFWAALWGAIIIGVVSWLLDLVLGRDD
ncbi:phage holin family protein [Planomonospora sp. ID82291]|uniref:phage holin family protein n=1 Tax=Planomonospora sp. ID82291 TaxID=2738136 RepID=UPI0018C375A0|nr:phage holin family protein [Planomonospora sp. ID82291]MBG0815467.1 phage holin family protein [Planomonospora sp. ID82291]